MAQNPILHGGRTFSYSKDYHPKFKVWSSSMVFEYGLRRLLFVIKVASQVAARHEGLNTIPERRLTQEKLFLKDDILRIHQINIGGQIYISDISDTTDTGQSGTKSQDYKLGGSDYLAVKSDGIGITDIAFRATGAGPEWILGSYSSRQFPTQISVIRCADVYRLRIIRDTLKCRAIIPLNRTGAEPYFQSPLTLPQDSWIDSSFSVETELNKDDDPFAYFARATYIPFDTMKKLTFDIDPGRLGINELTANDPSPPERYTSICFEDPPTKLRFFVCAPRMFGVDVPNFTQFIINGQWQPPLPHQPTVFVLRGPILVEHVRGIWWGEQFPSIPTPIGVVVSKREELKNTVLKHSDSEPAAP
ncbi:hypothetical protein PHISCL_09340 [Aspergillus sclerotialis]|uniref:Uncharacterized protein n=1 Tax=Aspergillus sclerotialis TaxID=2070753 RepID=A0A3A2Z5F2_9EURO|nr:hypothetical protein PHISCL_09340 [Aspergillus sclerotialis]